jgi:glycosyltransferase involved in cell wall biosynthesis
MLGTYEPRKGHAFALDALRRVLAAVPSAHLVICGYGRGDEVSAVRRLVDAAGLSDNVRLEPFRDDVGALLRAVDVLWVASQAFESFGLTVVEAWAEKVPVVATRVGGLPEVMGDGEGGFCVDPDDDAGFAECVVRLLDDPALRKTLGEGGYQRYRRDFTAERMAQEYARLLRDDARPRPVV